MFYQEAKYVSLVFTYQVHVSKIQTHFWNFEFSVTFMHYFESLFKSMKIHCVLAIIWRGGGEEKSYEGVGVTAMLTERFFRKRGAKSYLKCFVKNNM